jgi:hypothetical protein
MNSNDKETFEKACSSISQLFVLSPFSLPKNKIIHLSDTGTCPINLPSGGVKSPFYTPKIRKIPVFG